MIRPLAVILVLLAALPAEAGVAVRVPPRVATAPRPAPGVRPEASRAPIIIPWLAPRSDDCTKTDRKDCKK